MKEKENYSILRDPIAKFFRGSNFAFLGTLNKDGRLAAILEMKKVILSSFHSCSLDALERKGIEPDRILSFDSHIDTMLLGIHEGVLSMIDDNRSLRYAFTNGGTHTLMTKAFHYTDIDIVTPRVCLESNIALVKNRFP